MDRLSLDSANSYLKKTINSEKSELIARPGFVELAALEIKSDPAKIPSLAKRRRMYNLWRNAGVFPPNMKQWGNFCHEYGNALSASDAYVELRAPNEFTIIRPWLSPTVALPLEVLDPMVISSMGISPWTLELAGKRVLVVHPAKELISSQLINLEKLHRSRIWSKPVIATISPPQSNGLEIDIFSTWSIRLNAFLNDLKIQIEEFRPHVALVAAGSYGMPICKYLKESNVTSIYVGGALQLLFGIWGTRWRGNDLYLSDSTDFWIENTTNRPLGHRFVEDGCYW